VTSTTRTTSTSTAYLLFMLAISLLGLILLGVDAIAKLDPATRSILGTADTILCGLFFLDFLVTLARSPHRWKYLATWGWLDILSSIPAVEALRVGRLARVLRIVRVLRGVRSVRVISRFVLERRAQSAFMAAALLALLMLVFGAIAILHVERVPEANIRGPGDALWWAVVTLTTVGYGDRYPVTGEGRVIAVVLMLTGVGLFATLSGFLASWFLSPSVAGRNADDMDSLREENRILREILERGGRPTASGSGPAPPAASVANPTDAG
jgi:voltage-gated potassium channel